MNEHAWREKLTAEGFHDLMVYENGPDTDFGEHTHDQQTVHIILQGSLTLADANGSQQLHAGDRFDIVPGTMHSAKCGPDGCTFLVGAK